MLVERLKDIPSAFLNLKNYASSISICKRAESGSIMKISRRKFLETMGVMGAVVIITPLANVRDESNPLRPPGAIQEQDFINRCIRCNKCAEECPTGVIYYADWFSGKIADTPILSNSEDCNLCVRCVEVCPSGALLPIIPDSELDRHNITREEAKVQSDDLRLGVAQIDKNLCILFGGRNRECLFCYDVCPIKGEALQIDEYRRPVINIKLCYGCGLCQLVCPPYAINLPLRSVKRNAK